MKKKKKDKKTAARFAEVFGRGAPGSPRPLNGKHFTGDGHADKGEVQPVDDSRG